MIYNPSFFLTPHPKTWLHKVKIFSPHLKAGILVFTLASLCWFPTPPCCFRPRPPSIAPLCPLELRIIERATTTPPPLTNLRLPPDNDYGLPLAGPRWSAGFRAHRYSRSLETSTDGCQAVFSYKHQMPGVAWLAVALFCFFLTGSDHRPAPRGPPRSFASAAECRPSAPLGYASHEKALELAFSRKKAALGYSTHQKEILLGSRLSRRQAAARVGEVAWEASALGGLSVEEVWAFCLFSGMDLSVLSFCWFVTALSGGKSRV